MSLRVWAAHIKKQAWIWDDTYSIGQIAHLSRLLRDILPLPRPTSRLHGYNFIFNNQTNAHLGSDGYDNYQAPKDGARALFSRRMWVGGTLDHYSALQPNDVVRCTERVRAVRQVGASVFVTVGREMTRGEQRVMAEKRTLVYTNERYTEKPRADNWTHKPSRTHSAGDIGAPALLFRLSDVMRFCSLSYNLHKIHYDRQYCKLENLANVVVPGPLLALVMLHYVSSVLPGVEIGGFTYRNSLPCYIDELVDLILRPHGKDYEVHVMRGLQLLAGGVVTFRVT